MRGLHLSQAGIYAESPTSASLFDLALLVYQLDLDRLKHPLAIYIPKSESADEALWWRDVFAALAELKGTPKDYIKCDGPRRSASAGICSSKSSRTTCATICSGSTSGAGITWRA